MFSTFENTRDSIWSQQSTCTENSLDLFQILSFVILLMDLAYRQTLTLLTLKGVYLMIWFLCDNLFENNPYMLLLTEMSGGLELVNIWIKI